MRYGYIGMNRYFIYLMIVLSTLFYSGCTKKRGRVVNNVTGESVTSLVVLENKYDKTVVFEKMTDDAGYYSF